MYFFAQDCNQLKGTKRTTFSLCCNAPVQRTGIQEGNQMVTTLLTPKRLSIKLVTFSSVSSKPGRKTTKALGTCPFSLSVIPTTAASTILFELKSLDSKRYELQDCYVLSWRWAFLAECWAKFAGEAEFLHF